VKDGDTDILNEELPAEAVTEGVLLEELVVEDVCVVETVSDGE
jgi:hypothetical protein